MEEMGKLRGILKNGYGYIPKAVMKIRNISIKAKAVYAYLCSYSGNKNIAFPSQDMMCYDLQISLPSLYKYLQELLDYGLISKKQSRNNGSKYGNNVYTIKLDVNIEEPLYNNFDTKKLSEPLYNNFDTKNLVDQNLDNKDINTNNNSSNNNSNNNISILKKNSENALSQEQLNELINIYFKDTKDTIKELFKDFIFLRIEKGKSITSERQLKAFVDTLNRIKDNQGKEDCLNYSIRNEYTDIYIEDYKDKNNPIDITSDKKANVDEKEKVDYHVLDDLEVY